ncbi:preprotein translocase subunit SecE [Timonella sp. A28]|uniref:preprotein translocase subunit SecE n=1 Tax=Timonella sp. A28 TaxID=3442640 RepID=UPI003EB75E9C
MSESASGAVNGGASGSSTSKKTSGSKAPKKANIFARIALFVRQIIAELKKLVVPTRSEYFNYVTVVIMFVLVMMAFVLASDFLISKATDFLFG